jgi:hypothetical protein
MRLQFEAETTAGRPFDHPGKAGGRERRIALADEDEGRRRVLSLQATQRPQLVAMQRMCAWRPILDPAHVQDRGTEVDLVPTQVADLGRPQPMPERDQDHGRFMVLRCDPLAIALTAAASTRR